MDARLKNVFRSPFCRHPHLLARKVMARCGFADKHVFADPPIGVRWAGLPAWRDVLLAWMRASDTGAQPFAWTRVFRQDFDESFLLERCARGPLAERDIRGDIKLIWEFGRLQALFLAQAMGTETPSESASKLRRWLDANTNADGPSWINAMEVAIRAVNLAAADSVSGGRLAEAFGSHAWCRLMWNHARVIETRLEAKFISSNHYLADLLGLSVLGAGFVGSPDAHRWFAFASGEFQHALLSQSFVDGGAYEASLPYHALVTEMALLLASLPGIRPLSAFTERLLRMNRIMADMQDIDGDVFRFGDDDGGRVLPLDFVSRSQGRAEVLLVLAGQLGLGCGPCRPTAVYPDSGWTRFSAGPWTLAVEFGGVGFRGQGAHAHCDTLSFCLNHQGARLLIDPGSYIYSPDPEARHAFRSTTSHNTIRIDRAEHHADRRERHTGLFSLPGPEAPAQVIDSGPQGITIRFSPTPGVTTTRSLALADGVSITDEITGAGRRVVEWFLILAPGSQVSVDATGADVVIAGGMAFRIATPTKPAIETASASPFYGTRETTTRLRCETECDLPRRFHWSITKKP